MRTSNRVADCPTSSRRHAGVTFPHSSAQGYADKNAFLRAWLYAWSPSHERCALPRSGCGETSETQGRVRRPARCAAFPGSWDAMWSVIAASLRTSRSAEHASSPKRPRRCRSRRRSGHGNRHRPGSASEHQGPRPRRVVPSLRRWSNVRGYGTPRPPPASGVPFPSFFRRNPRGSTEPAPRGRALLHEFIGFSLGAVEGSSVFRLSRRGPSVRS